MSTTDSVTDTGRATKTSYVIVREIKAGVENAPHYEPVTAGIEAASAEAAIRSYFDTNAGATGGTFVAVPARSWKPVTVKVETRTHIQVTA